MPKLKVLSWKDVIKVLEGFGFRVVKQTWSHIKLKRIVMNIKQLVIVPNHFEIDKWTLRAIFNQVSKFVSESELMKYFYL